MRLIIFFLIGLGFGGLGGYVIGSMGGHSMAHDHDSHNHGTLAWTGEDPMPTITLTSDGDTGGINGQINVENFTFSPEDVNQDPTQGQGHAHLYLNEVKIGRLYSPYFHIEAVEEGDVIGITLNADDHSVWTLDDRPLIAQATVE